MTLHGINIEKTALSASIKVGISQCLLGENVRYDGGNKRLSFAADMLQPYVNYVAICPEMAIGLPSPRPTIGLYQTAALQTIIRFNEIDDLNIHDKMVQFCQQTVEELSDLCGYIVCAKSPSCGLNSAKLFNNENKQFISMVDGLFTAALRQRYPWMPIEDNIRLNELEIQSHFLIRLLAVNRLNQLENSGLTRHKLLAFHSRYKLLLLAHSQPSYRQLGPFVAKMSDWHDLNVFFIEYRRQFMNLLSTAATIENHTNALMHIQGYFNRYLTAEQKRQLTDIILSYRRGEVCLSEPISYLKNYLKMYPNEYLSQQYYFIDFPDTLL